VARSVVIQISNLEAGPSCVEFGTLSSLTAAPTRLRFDAKDFST
jgi:hypothetical protein